MDSDFRTIIEPDELVNVLTKVALFDCRFSLANTEAGRAAYESAHIPGAIYVHLDDDLSGVVVPGQTSRHPLPDPDSFSKMLRDWGVTVGQQVVVYDDLGGAIAGRMWWMLNWLGHERVAVLNGGYPSWIAAGFETSAVVPRPSAGDFVPTLRKDLVVDAETILGGDGPVADSRAAERYAGKTEPIDPVAGHIPGAMSLPFGENVDQTGRFRSRDDLRERFSELATASPIFYCGSGVTAAHNVLSMVHAGYAMPRMYPGSWSEWITDPARPIEKS